MHKIVQRLVAIPPWTGQVPLVKRALKCRSKQATVTAGAALMPVMFQMATNTGVAPRGTFVSVVHVLPIVPMQTTLIAY